MWAASCKMEKRKLGDISKRSPEWFVGGSGAVNNKYWLLIWRKRNGLNKEKERVFAIQNPLAARFRQAQIDCVILMVGTESSWQLVSIVSPCCYNRPLRMRVLLIQDSTRWEHILNHEHLVLCVKCEMCSNLREKLSPFLDYNHTTTTTITTTTNIITPTINYAMVEDAITVCEPHRGRYLRTPLLCLSALPKRR